MSRIPGSTLSGLLLAVSNLVEFKQVHLDPYHVCIADVSSVGVAWVALPVLHAAHAERICDSMMGWAIRDLSQQG